MDMNEYQQLALRTARPTDDFTEKIVGASLSLCGEAGELANMIKKFAWHGHDLNAEAVALELGDILWYVACMAEAINTPLAEIAEKNVDKLKRRYPQGFSETASRDRAE